MAPFYQRGRSDSVTSESNRQLMLSTKSLETMLSLDVGPNVSNYDPVKESTAASLFSAPLTWANAAIATSTVVSHLPGSCKDNSCLLLEQVPHCKSKTSLNCDEFDVDGESDMQTFIDSQRDADLMAAHTVVPLGNLVAERKFTKENCYHYLDRECDDGSGDPAIACVDPRNAPDDVEGSSYHRGLSARSAVATTPSLPASLFIEQKVENEYDIKLLKNRKAGSTRDIDKLVDDHFRRSLDKYQDFILRRWLRAGWEIGG